MSHPSLQAERHQIAPNYAAIQETRPVRALFPKIYSFSDPWIVDDTAARALAKIRRERSLEGHRLQAQSTRRWNASISSSSISDFSIRRGNVGIARGAACKPANPPLRQCRSRAAAFRLLTGNVSGSRRCDCGDQLRLALALLEDLGGGIIHTCSG
jgi:GTP cyclohydrolase II